MRAEKALETTRVQLEDVVDDLKGRTDELAKLISKESAKLSTAATPDCSCRSGCNRPKACQSLSLYTRSIFRSNLKV